ncbi:MAG: hypothetical protein ABIL25_01710, partial [candidate division WOR-3 bacterium]
LTNSFHGKGWSDYASCFEYFSYVRQRGSFEYIFGEATRVLDTRQDGHSISTSALKRLTLGVRPRRPRGRGRGL